MKRTVLFLMLAVCIVFASTAAYADFTLSGNFTQVGVNANGGMIDNSGSPSIGWRWDFAGGGAFGPGDVIVPGFPWQFIAVGAGGSSASVSSAFGNGLAMTAFNTSAGNTLKATASGTFPGFAGNVSVTETIQFGKMERYPIKAGIESQALPVHITLQVFNGTGAVLPDVIVATGFDPDQDVFLGGSFATFNFAGSNFGQAFIGARGPLTNITAYILDENTDNTVGAGVPSTRVLGDDNVYDLITGGVTTGLNDYQIAMAWQHIGDMPVNDILNVQVDYLLVAAPIPASALLLGSGLLGLLGLRRRS